MDLSLVFRSWPKATDLGSGKNLSVHCESVGTWGYSIAVTEQSNAKKDAVEKWTG